MNRYGMIIFIAILFFFISPVSGQELTDQPEANNISELDGGSISLTAADLTSIITVVIFSVTILFTILISARIHSNTSKFLLEKAYEKNKELPQELQESVSEIIKAFPKAEPLGLPRGSLLAIVMLIFSIAFVFLLFFPFKQLNETVRTLEIILAIIIGFYFGSNYGEAKTIKIVEKVYPEEPKFIQEVFETKEIKPAEEKREDKKRKVRKKEEFL